MYPRNRIDEVLTQVRHDAQQLSDDERRMLVEIYRDYGIPTDQLNESPHELEQLAVRFNAKTQKQFSGTRLLSELLRMRKQAKLPRIVTHPN